jgi:hypothetical protein
MSSCDPGNEAVALAGDSSGIRMQLEHGRPAQFRLDSKPPCAYVSSILQDSAIEPASWELCPSERLATGDIFACLLLRIPHHGCDPNQYQNTKSFCHRRLLVVTRCKQCAKWLPVPTAKRTPLSNQRQVLSCVLSGISRPRVWDGLRKSDKES